MHASVELAWAGERGNGFAMVAVEVRNLAEQSRQAMAQAAMHVVAGGTQTASMFIHM